MTDLELIQAKKQIVKNDLTDRVEIIYQASSPKEKDELVRAFKNLFEGNWGIYAAKIRIA